MVRAQKLNMSVEEQAEMEYTNYLAAKSKAVEDFNVMIGNIEDPSEDDEEEGE